MQDSRLISKDQHTRVWPVRRIAVSSLKSSRYQVRDAAFFDKEELENLAASIKSVGLLQLPKVRIHPENPQAFEIVSGHRRIRAASEILGWEEVECEVLECEDEFRIFQLCLEENIQRHNLSSYEEGIAFLISEKLFGLSQEQIAESLHQSRATVQSKRQLALLANSYLQYAESTYSNAFLRNVNLKHIAVLSKLNPDLVKHAIRMIARGVTVRHLERFATLFSSNEFQPARSRNGSVESNGQRVSKTRISLAENMKLQSIRQRIHELGRESPESLKAGLNELEESILEIIEINKALANESKRQHDKKISCPKCGNLLDL